METQHKKGFVANMIAGFIGVLVITLVAVSAIIPALVTAPNLTLLDSGTRSLYNLMPLLLIVAIIMIVVGLAFSAMRRD